MRIGAIVMFVLALASGAGAAAAQGAAPQPIEIPPWFATTFLDFREDIADAAREHKRLLVYFGQDGCPYCAKLMGVNFAQRSIVETTRRHFVAIALDLWGDRETTWIDGRKMPEKELARQLRVQFTPTLLFFDEQGKVVARLDGYWPPQRFEAVLDYVAAQARATSSRSRAGCRPMSGRKRARRCTTSRSSWRRPTTWRGAPTAGRSP